MSDPVSNTGWLIADPSAESGALETLPETPGLEVISIDNLRECDLRFSSDDIVCITSEAVMDTVVSRIDDPTRRKAIGLMKDKTAFRELMKDLYPDFYFKQIEAEELPNLQLNEELNYVIKPVKGCFGSGVRTIRGDADLGALAEEISSELKKNSLIFSDNVLSSNELIVEEYIEGEEFAVDMYYNSEGEPVITNIYHHPMPSNPAYLHMLYYSSNSVFRELYDQAMTFFQKLNNLLHVSRLPIHSEFRLRAGELVPVELNALRFGGMGLTNLSYYAFGLNAYQCLIHDSKPDWDAIWHNNRENVYGFFIAYNGKNVDVETHKPDWTSFRKNFSNIILEVPFDYQKQLAFGILYIEEHRSRVKALLSMEFDDYFIKNFE